nr:glycosyltransferase family 4 protein [Nocardioides sp. zg-1308]
MASGLRSRGHDVSVLTGFPNYPTGAIYPGYTQAWRGHERLPDGVVVHRVPLFPSHDGRAVPRGLNYLSFAASAATAARSALESREALWVFNSPGTVPLVAARERRRRGLPYLLHIMDVWPDSVLDSGMVGGRVGRMVGSALDRVVGRGYAEASRIAVTSRGQADLLVSRGVPPAKVEYCPVWVDEDVFRPRPHDRSVLPEGLRDSGRIVMYAGAIGHVQQLDVAVRAAVAVAGTGLQLVLVGSGIAEQGLRDLVDELGGTNVHFLGRWAPEEMGRLGAAADAHLVSLADTPLLRITMPSKLPAVLAMERPVVMFGSGDAADVVRDSGGGLCATDLDGLIDSFDTLAGATDTQLAEWGSAGRRRYEEEFSLARGLTAVEHMLADIVGP